MVSDLKYFDGSLAKIDRVPAPLRELYATAFEIDAAWIVEAGARRQKWIDQAQSLNIYMAGASGKKLDDTYKLAWMRGLKTTYYLRTLAATSAEKSTGHGGELNAVSESGGDAGESARKRSCKSVRSRSAETEVLRDRRSRVRGVPIAPPDLRSAAMTAALRGFASAPEAVQAEALRERMQVLESRPGVREVLLVTSGGAPPADDEHAVIVLSGGGGGFAVTCPGRRAARAGWLAVVAAAAAGVVRSAVR